MLKERIYYENSEIKGDAIMLGKYGEIVPCIDNLYHPNPGRDLSEIERCIDWILLNNLESSVLKDDILGWFENRVDTSMYECDPEDFEEFTKAVMYSDTYEVCNKTKSYIKKAISNVLNSNYDGVESEEYYGSKIADWINSNFTRVRAGGKLNPEGTNSIYFRISSKGYDWTRTIIDFLWDTFKDPSRMPDRIWVGHDEENNPPEVVLFDGSPNDLIDYDHIRLESNKVWR